MRLIPARAGNIPRRLCPAAYRAAHPRSRGEHLRTLSVPFSGGGSSPLARGTFIAFNQHRRALRLIPARAGNMISAKSFRRAMTAHPRSRGEHKFSFSLKSFTSGSSPLARGTCSGRGKTTAMMRLIPARAGNMAVAPEHGWVDPAHPRSRGEHEMPLSSSSLAVGSSPLARGT